MKKNEIQRAILKFLSRQRGRKMLTSVVRKEIFPFGKKTNPKDPWREIQKAILVLKGKRKVEILNPNSYTYLTTAEIKRQLKKEKITTICELPGIEKASKKFFFSKYVFVRIKQ
jgi:hypothetical protein